MPTKNSARKSFIRAYFGVTSTEQKLTNLNFRHTATGQTQNVGPFSQQPKNFTSLVIPLSVADNSSTGEQPALTAAGGDRQFKTVERVIPVVELIGVFSEGNWGVGRVGGA